MEKENPSGLCMCGCGRPAPIAKETRKQRGYAKGDFIRFIPGHNRKGPTGADSKTWKGGRIITPKGYVLVLRHGHPRADKNGYVSEHILVAEEVLGKPLPSGAVVHHANEDHADNRPENLVICQDNAYHKFLHQRMRALKACGHASWRKCPYCKQYDDPILMWVGGKRGQAYHRSCATIYAKSRYLKGGNECIRL